MHWLLQDFLLLFMHYKIACCRLLTRILILWHSQCWIKQKYFSLLYVPICYSGMFQYFFCLSKIIMELHVSLGFVILVGNLCSCSIDWWIVMMYCEILLCYPNNFLVLQLQYVKACITFDFVFIIVSSLSPSFLL